MPPKLHDINLKSMDSRRSHSLLRRPLSAARPVTVNKRNLFDEKHLFTSTLSVCLDKVVKKNPPHTLSTNRDPGFFRLWKVSWKYPSSRRRRQHFDNQLYGLETVFLSTGIIKTTFFLFSLDCFL